MEAICKHLIYQEANFRISQKADVVPTYCIDLVLEGGIIVACISGKRHE